MLGNCEETMNTSVFLENKGTANFIIMIDLMERK